jgi:hypothetical protein
VASTGQGPFEEASQALQLASASYEDNVSNFRRFCCIAEKGW